MSTTWWVGQDDLDDDQKKVITLPLKDSKTVIGPPGSGKTNLLLLRANYMYLAGCKNILIIVFTHNLQEFISLGGARYEFPVSKVQTSRSWECDLLRQYGISIVMPEDFYEQRTYLVNNLNNLISKHNVEKLYDCILLDEAQDYLPEEINIFARLTHRLFAVADSRQKIYPGEDSLDTLQEVTGKPFRLRFHYRNGLKICKLADGIAKNTGNYERMASTSNYDETANPSTVEHFRCKDINDQANRIISKLITQIKAYPGDMFGIICPRREELMHLWSYIIASPLGELATVHIGNGHESFQPDKPIILTTFHGIKGLEVRALHMACCDLLKKFEFNRNITYTAVTRAKTSLSLYYSDDIHGYLESALAGLEPPPDLPDLQDIFGGKK